MMNKREYLSYLNVAGAISSILALFLTISQNNSFAFIIKVLVAISFFVATAGTLAAWANWLRVRIIKEPKWSYNMLFWLLAAALIISVSFAVASVSFILTSGCFQLWRDMIQSIKSGVI